MWLPLEQTLRPIRDLPVPASWYAFCAAWLFAIVLLIGLACQDWELFASARSADETFPKARESRQADDPSKVHAASGTSGQVDFVYTLPSTAEPDTTIRFTSKLAQDQDVRISQIQSEFVATDPKKLGQTKFTLQLRGDYPNIKNVVIGLLAKFPGLTLQRLTVHHRDNAAGTPPDKSNDEASIELLQFTQPTTPS